MGSEEALTFPATKRRKPDQASSSTKASTSLCTSTPSDQAASSSSAAAALSSSKPSQIVNMRGANVELMVKYVELMVALQGSHVDRAGNAWKMDCGLCAVKNVTVQPEFALQELLAVIKPKDQASSSRSPSRLVEHGNGNFSGAALMMFLESKGYACTSQRGNSLHHIEFQCLVFGRRVVGVVWRLGGVSSTSVQMGHWLSMSYEHDPSLRLKDRSWHVKDSMKDAVQTIHSVDAMVRIKEADVAGCDWFVVIDYQ